MSVNLFELSDELIANVIQASAFGQNTQTANLLLATAKPAVPPANASLNEAQISLIMNAIDTHFAHAQKYAILWEKGDAASESIAIKDYVQNTLLAFARFAQHMDREYADLIDAAYDNDNLAVRNTLIRFKGTLEILLAETKGSKTALASYQDGLATVLAVFNQDFDKVLAEVGIVAAEIKELKGLIASLQDDIAANNSAVLDTFIDTAGTEIEQGVTIAGAAADEDIGAIVSAGVQMGVAYVKGLKKIIELNDKTLQDILAIRQLGSEVSEDQMILVALLNIGTLLTSLGATQGLQLSVVADVIDYFTQLDQDIDGLLKNHADNLPAQIDTTNYSPATVGLKNPAFPPWNVLVPTDRAARVFQKVVSLQATIFDDHTQFAALDSNQNG